MVGPEERGKAQRFGGLCDGELVGVGGALLRFDEYPEVHDRHIRRRCLEPPMSIDWIRSLVRA